jgi:hypothetical protein
VSAKGPRRPWSVELEIFECITFSVSAFEDYLTQMKEKTSSILRAKYLNANNIFVTTGKGKLSTLAKYQQSKGPL